MGRAGGGGREALLNHIPFRPNGGQDFSHSSKERPLHQAPSFPPQQNPVGREMAFFFSFLIVSDGRHITNSPPLLSPNNQLVPNVKAQHHFASVAKCRVGPAPRRLFGF